MNNQNNISENSFARWAIYQGWDSGASKELRGASPLTESQMQFVLDRIRSGETENRVSTLDDSMKQVSAYLYSLGTDLKNLVKEPSVVTFNFEFLKAFLTPMYNDLSNVTHKGNFKNSVKEFSDQIEEYLKNKSKILQDSLDEIGSGINKIEENKPNIRKCNNHRIVNQLKDSEEVIKQVHNLMVDSEESLHKKLDAALELLMKNLENFYFDVKCCSEFHGFEEAKTRFFGTENKGVKLFQAFIDETNTLVEEANQSLEQAVEEILKDFEGNLVKEDDTFFFGRPDDFDWTTDGGTPTPVTTEGETPVTFVSDTRYTPYTPYSPRPLSSLGRPVSVEPPVKLIEEEMSNGKTGSISDIRILRDINPFGCPMMKSTGKTTGVVRNYSTGALHPAAEQWLGERSSTVFNSRQENPSFNKGKVDFLNPSVRSIGTEVDSIENPEKDTDLFFPMDGY